MATQLHVGPWITFRKRYFRAFAGVAKRRANGLQATLIEWREKLPGVFNAAGLMVPDPSIMLPPIPFIDDDGGSGAEYMVASLA